MADNQGQDIVSLGLDVSSFTPAKKSALDEFIVVFEKLAKYDGMKINPILGEGIVTFNQKLTETSRLASEINEKMKTMGTYKGASPGAGAAADAQKANEKLTASIAAQSKENASLRVQLAEIRKLLDDEAKSNNSLYQARMARIQAAKDEATQRKQLEKDAVSLQKEADAEKSRLLKKQAKDVKDANAQQIADAKKRAAEMDKNLKDEEKSVQSLTNKYQQLKNVLKQKETAYANNLLGKGKDHPETKASKESYEETATTFNKVEKQLDRASEGANRLGAGFRTLFGHMRNIAYILPGLGIAGIFNLAFEAIGSAAGALGIFDSKLDKALDKQIEVNQANKDLVEILKQVADAQRTVLGLEQQRGDTLRYLQASNKSTLDRLNAEKDLLSTQSLKTNQEFFTNEGFKNVEDMNQKLRELGATYSEMKVKLAAGDYKKDFFDGSKGPGNEIAEKQIKAIAIEYNALIDKIEQAKSINEANANNLSLQKQKELEIFEHVEEQKRKLLLENAKIASDLQIDRNRIILGDERSMLDDRLKAINAIAAAEKSASQAQKKYVLARPDSRNADGQLTTEAKVALSEADADITKAERKRLDDRDKVQESYRQRRLKALEQMAKDQINSEAIANERVYKNDTESLEDRLVAYALYVQKRQKLQDEEYKLAIEKRGLTKEEKQALDSDRKSQQANIQADVERQVYEIVTSSLDKQIKAVKDANDIQDKERQDEYTKELEALNKNLKDKTISYRKFQAERMRLDKQYQREILDEAIVDDEADIGRLQKEKIALEARERANQLETNSAQVDFNFAEAGGKGSDLPASKKKLDAAIGEGKAIKEAIKKINKEIQDEEYKLSDDRNKRAKLDYDELLDFQKKYADNTKLILQALFDFIQTLNDARFARDMENIEKRRDMFGEANEDEADAIEKSSLAEKDKVALQIQLDAEKMVAEKNFAMEEKRLKEQKAKFDKALNIAHILWNTQESISTALLTPPPMGEILAQQRAALGAIQIATVIATDIPSYEFGTEDHKGGKARYGEAGPEVIIEPGKKPYIVTQETISDLPKHTKVIPIEESPIFGRDRTEDMEWERTRWMVKQLKPKVARASNITNVVNIDLGFENYKYKKLYGG